MFPPKNTYNECIIPVFAMALDCTTIIQLVQTGKHAGTCFGNVSHCGSVCVPGVAGIMSIIGDMMLIGFETTMHGPVTSA